MSKKPGAESTADTAAEGPWDEFQRRATEAWQDWTEQSAPASAAAGGGDAWAERIRAGLDGYYGWLGQLGAVTATGPAGAAGGPAAGGDTYAGAAESQPWGPWVEAMQRGDFKTMQSLLMQTPGLGSGRAEQERQKALAAAWMEYVAASQAYEALVRRSQIRGGEVLRERLDRLCAENGSFESLRQIYDEWIDSAEAAYMDAALSDEFSRVYGALVNAQVRLRDLQREHIEQQARSWGLPVSGDVDALGERVESLRRELRQAQLKIAELEARLDGKVAAARGPEVTDRPVKGAARAASKATAKAASKPGTASKSSAAMPRAATSSAGKAGSRPAAGSSKPVRPRKRS
ncbi:poly(R)-hydroxyalkanoic acid synthase subunit PhaE [Frateuria aurantia]